MTHPKLAVVKSGFGGRGYGIPGRTRVSPATGKTLQRIYPSVTTVLKQINKPGLHQWIADQTAAKAVTSLSYLQGCEQEVGYRALRFTWSRNSNEAGGEVREYYERVVQDAAELGTNMHEWSEADIDGMSEYPEPMSVETDEMIEAWIEWHEHHTIISHNQEFTIVNDTLGIAGTADADWSIRCDHEGPCLGQEPGQFVRTLVDLKTARNTWNDHGYQLAALASAEVIMREVVETHPDAIKAEKTEAGKKVISFWVEDAPPVWERYALLHIRPDDYDTQGNLIPRFCVLKDRTDDMDLYRIGFEGALALCKMEAELKSRAKARTKETEKH